MTTKREGKIMNEKAAGGRPFPHGTRADSGPPMIAAAIVGVGVLWAAWIVLVLLLAADDVREATDLEAATLADNDRDCMGGS